MYGYAAPPTDIISGSVSGSIVGSLGDGTQIWRIFHNGVDTHPIHVHLFNAQLLNRVGQDGIMLPPDANELGWKDTFRINPLEITFLAMKPIIPTPAQLPFAGAQQRPPDRPDAASQRPADPAAARRLARPAGNRDQSDPEPRRQLRMGVRVALPHPRPRRDGHDALARRSRSPPNAPTGLSAVVTGSGSGRAIVLNWTDNSLNETGFTIQRANDAAFLTGLQTFTVAAERHDFTATSSATRSASFYFRVFASNVVGDTQVYPASTGFPTKTTTSGFSNTALVNTNVVPAAPSAVTVTGAVLSATRAIFTVRWTDNSTTRDRIQGPVGTGTRHSRAAWARALSAPT